MAAESRGSPGPQRLIAEASPLAAIDRVGQLVFTRIRHHPLLQPLRDAGIIVYLSMHQEAIWVSILPSKTDPGRFEAEYQVEHPRWWSVGKYPLEEHADRLVGALQKAVA